jgi:hypothetical protein
VPGAGNPHRGKAILYAARFIGGFSGEDITSVVPAERDAEYAEIVRTTEYGHRGFGRPARPARPTPTEGRDRGGAGFLRRPCRSAAERAVTDAEAQLRRSADGDGGGAGITRADHQGRVWVTRNGMHVDRIASARLIRRFLDQDKRLRPVDPDWIPPGCVRGVVRHLRGGVHPRGGSVHLGGTVRPSRPCGRGAPGDRRDRSRHRPCGRHVRPDGGRVDRAARRWDPGRGTRRRGSHHARGGGIRGALPISWRAFGMRSPRSARHSLRPKPPVRGPRRALSPAESQHDASPPGRGCVP